MRAMRAGLLGAGMLALAQAGAGLAADAVEGDAAADITVTGTRIVQNRGTPSKTNVDPRDVPAAIAVVPDAIIQGQGDRTLNEVLANASAVAPNYGGGYGIADNYVVRGLPVRFLRDGLPDGPTFGYRRTIADIEAVEVLKGPGSALYGKAEAGGSVNIVTKGPLDRFAASAEAAYGGFDSLYLTGDLGGPIAAGIDGRLIGHHERTDGYRGLARRATEVLPTIAIELGPDHVLTLDYDYRDSRVVADNYGIPFTRDRTIAAIDPASRLYSPFNQTFQTIHRATITDRAKVSPVLELRGALVFDHRDIGLIRNAGGNVLNAAGVMTGRGGRIQADSDDFWTAQAEAVLTPKTGAVAHTILLGAEYASAGIGTVRRTYNLPDVAVTPGSLVLASDSPALIGAGALAFDRHISSDTLSVYAQEQADIADLVKVRVGGRWDSVKLVDAGIAANVRRRIAGTRDLFSWQAGAVVKASEAVNVYGGYAKGKFVAINTEPTALTPDPERSDQFEAGVKTSLLGGKLSANAALFQTRRAGYYMTLTPGADPLPVGRQRSRGAELDLLGRPLDGLTLIGNFAYLDAVNRSDALASVSGLAGAVNLPVQGKQIPSTPRASGSLWAQYDWKRGALAGLFVGAGATYKAATYVDSLELLRVPGYVIGRASLGYGGRGIAARLTVSNPTNKRYFSVPTFVGALPGEPRQLQVSLKASF